MDDDLYFIATTLRPLPIIAWGELALRFLGMPTILNSFMLGVDDAALSAAAEKLLAVGFTRQTWSSFTRDDPTAQLATDEGFKRMYDFAVPGYANFDAKTLRFVCYDGPWAGTRVELLPWTYIRLEVTEASLRRAVLSQPAFYIAENVHFPNAVALLESVMRVWMEEKSVVPRSGEWPLMLRAWAGGYLYHELQLRDDVLDGCEDGELRREFDEMIRRKEGRPRVREKWGRPKEPITNELIKDFQIESTGDRGVDFPGLDWSRGRGTAP